MAEDSVVREFPTTAGASDGPTRGVEDVVESGHVLAFPHLPFVLEETERRFLDPRWADPKAKNVSVRWPVAASCAAPPATPPTSPRCAG